MKSVFRGLGAVLAFLMILSAIGYLAGKPATLADSVGVGLHQSVDFIKAALKSAKAS
jgi:hypothetical protein